MLFHSTFNFLGRANKLAAAQAVRIQITTKIQMHRINPRSCDNYLFVLPFSLAFSTFSCFLHSVFFFLLFFISTGTDSVEGK